MLPDVCHIVIQKAFVIAITWVVRMYVEITHELQLVDYLTYRWANMVNLFYITYISVDLIFCA